MPLQTSGAISLGNIQTEFGGSAPTSLSEYYDGGIYVTTSNGGKIPTISTPLKTNKFSNYYGASKAIDTGVFAMGDTGSFSKTLPNGLKTFMLLMTAQWGGSQEQGSFSLSTASSTPIDMCYCEDGSTLSSPYNLYSVNKSTGAETLIPINGQWFPGGVYHKSSGPMYFEVQNIPITSISSQGAGGRNPTRFIDGRVYTNYNRSSILSSILNTSTVYYVVR